MQDFTTQLASNGSGEDDTTTNSTSAELQSNSNEVVPAYMQHMTTILVTLHVTVFITGLVGNSLVCLSVYRNKSLQTVTNYYIVNLAVADFLVILICLPPTVYWDLYLTWNFGLVLCKLVLYLQSISVSVSVLTLTCISVDRWYAICRPLKFKSSKQKAKIIIVSIWLVSMLIASPDVIFLTTRPLYEENGFYYMDCTYSWPESNTKMYQLCIVTLLFVSPFILMSISYSHIFNVLWRNETMAESLQSSFQVSTPAQHQEEPQQQRLLLFRTAPAQKGHKESTKSHTRSIQSSNDASTDCTNPSIRHHQHQHPLQHPHQLRGPQVGSLSANEPREINANETLQVCTRKDGAPAAPEDNQKQKQLQWDGAGNPIRDSDDGIIINHLQTTTTNQQQQHPPTLGPLLNEITQSRDDQNNSLPRPSSAPQKWLIPIEASEASEASAARSISGASTANQNAQTPVTESSRGSPGANQTGASYMLATSVARDSSFKSNICSESIVVVNSAAASSSSLDAPSHGRQQLASASIPSSLLSCSQSIAEADSTPLGAPAAVSKMGALRNLGRKLFVPSRSVKSAIKDVTCVKVVVSGRGQSSSGLVCSPTSKAEAPAEAPSRSPPVVAFARANKGSITSNGNPADSSSLALAPGRGANIGPGTNNNRHGPANSSKTVTSSSYNMSTSCTATSNTPMPLRDEQSNFNQLHASSHTRFCKLIESRKKAAKMLIVIVIMFGLCYLPIHFLNILRYTVGLPQNDLISIASLVSHWLCYFNSAVNPLIYNLMSGASGGPLENIVNR